MTLWVCRAGRNGEYENYFLENKVIAITWAKLDADLTLCENKDAVKKILTELYPDEKKNAISNFTGQLYPFVRTMKIGEKVLLPSKITPGIYYVGTIRSECIHLEGQMPYSHIRKVEWSDETISRSNLDADIQHSLGAFLTIFSIDAEKESRIFAVGKTHKAPRSNGPDAIRDTNIEDDAMDQITSMILSKFKGYDMQRVIDSIFRAKGYSTYVPPKGPDKGIDVLACNGPLGFGGTKICIQVKTEDTPLGLPVFTELIGSMNKIGAEYGLLVSWSGFRTTMEQEKRDSFFRVKFWDHNDIVREFLDNYEGLDEWIKDKIPLKKIWVVDDQFDSQE